jgi:glycosyltransferase involved in cell wall biosynthesis
MIIHAYILCWNEEKILKHTLDYYTKYCDRVILIDNMSTDSSLDIAKKYSNVDVTSYDTNNTIMDNMYVAIKSHVYKQSRGKADWVVICDCDEIVYGLDSLRILDPNTDIPYLEGYQMMVNSFDEFSKARNILDIKTGFRDKDFDKTCLFNPNLDVQFGIGCHNSSITPNTNAAHCKLLHYKYLGRDYIKWKNARSAARLSEFNTKHGFGVHYLQSEEETDKMFDSYLPKLIQVI